jgi:hypothetical protein
VLLAGGLSALFSCITGYLLSLDGGYDEDLVSWHMWMGIVTTIVALAWYVWLRRGGIARAGMAGRVLAVDWVLAIGLLVLVGVTGHLGGSLTHGPDYLSAPLSGRQPEKPVELPPIANVQEAKAYDDVIKPILQTRCYLCHGPSKQKGDLRMDNTEGLLKGGKDGKLFVAGKPAESELMKRLLLPAEDEHHMPPKGKQALTEGQLDLIQWWIEQGADLTKPVKALTQSEKIRPILLALQGRAGEGHHASALPSLVPSIPVEPAGERAIAALKGKGADLMPVAQGSNYLEADLIGFGGSAGSLMALLPPLQKQLVLLNANNMRINDSALVYIGQCTNLRSLELSGGDITDKGIALLGGLKDLQVLNLVGTKVTGAGLMTLRSLKALRVVYLYKAQVNGKDWSMLVAAFPRVKLDTGGYSVPLLPVDTMVVKSPAAKK